MLYFAKPAIMLCIPFQTMSGLHSEGKLVDERHFLHSQTRLIVPTALTFFIARFLSLAHT